MVHALQEIQRVLAPGGLLVDLRPLLDRWPAEVAWADDFEEVGRATDLEGPLSDDAAANAVMDALASAGDLLREQQETFPLFYYWDTPKEMREYITGEWDDVIAVKDDVWRDLGSLWARSGADARVRLRVKMMIARYRKPDAPII